MNVLVIGGGAAGMMAACKAAEYGANVTLLEKNEKLGKKIYITGKGRCNVTNSSDIEVIFKNINRNPKFLYSAIYGFDNSMVMEFFENNGCKLKEERGNRVFPVSDHASDIIKALSKKLNDYNVKVMLNTKVKDLIISDGTAKGIVLDNGRELFGDRVIVATGGLSYPTTGSNGDGLRFAEKSGHVIVPCEGSLVPVETYDTWPTYLMGLSLKNVRLTLFKDNKKLYEDMGEMLFTHFGISGPLVLSSSAFIDFKKGENYTYKLDLKPALTLEQLDDRLLKDFSERQNKQFKNSLDELLPQKMIPIIVDLSKIDPNKKINEVTREERRSLANLLKNIPIGVLKLRPINEAIITRGGVSVKDINPSTMESKLVHNLYFCGEVIDVDAMTGGFNLQIAWSTGALAGNIL